MVPTNDRTGVAMKLKELPDNTTLGSFKLCIPAEYKQQATKIGLIRMDVYISYPTPNLADALSDASFTGFWVKVHPTSERIYPITNRMGTFHEILEWETIPTKPKKVVCDLLGYRECVSVRRGRGTSWNWIYIETPTKVAREMRDTVEKKLLDLGLVGTYLSDGSDIRNTNVLWDINK